MCLCKPVLPISRHLSGYIQYEAGSAQFPALSFSPSAALMRVDTAQVPPSHTHRSQTSSQFWMGVEGKATQGAVSYSELYLCKSRAIPGESTCTSTSKFVLSLSTECLSQLLLNDAFTYSRPIFKTKAMKLGHPVLYMDTPNGTEMPHACVWLSVDLGVQIWTSEWDISLG